ncbi:MAG: RtcB family protein [Thiohalomonadaceae bacterium]
MSDIFEPFKAGNIYKMRHGNVWATLVMNDQLFGEYEYGALTQVRASMELPGIEKVSVMPDSHFGYGVAIGTTLESSTHLYPDTVGVDPACSVGMSEININVDSLSEKEKREAIRQVSEAVGVGNQLRDTGMTSAKFQEIVDGYLRPEGAWVNSYEPLWKERDTPHYKEFKKLMTYNLTENMLKQFNTIGGGNHFLSIEKNDIGQNFVASHFGSRGLGNKLARVFDATIKKEISSWGGRLANDLIYVPAESALGQVYYTFNRAMLEIATYNHYMVHEAVARVFHQGVNEFSHIPHNFIEYRNGKYIGRKGTIPAYDNNGIPMVVLGNMKDGSAIFTPGNVSYGDSVPHGAGRTMSRGNAKKILDQDVVNLELEEAGIMGNFEDVPIDESSGAYKNFDEVVKVIEDTGIGVLKFRTKPVLVWKDGG